MIKNHVSKPSHKFELKHFELINKSARKAVTGTSQRLDSIFKCQQLLSLQAYSLVLGVFVRIYKRDHLY